MDIRKLQRAIVDGLEDIKGQDIVVFNTEHLSSLFERVIIASGTSNRQTKALAAGVRAAVRAAGFPVLATEGGDNGEWIIVDCGAAVAHIFQPAIRDYYRLEEIWGGKPVKMKLGERSTGLVKASEPEDDEDDVAMAPNRKAAAKKLPAKLPAKRAPAKTAASPLVVAKKVAKKVALSAAARSTSDRPAAKKALAAEVAARQEAARKTAARKTAATKTVGAKTAATKTAAGKTAGAKTTAVRTTTARTAAAKPAPARKLSPRTAAAQPVEAVWDNNPGKTAPRKKAAPLGPVTKTLVVKPVARKTAVAKPDAPAARRKPAAVAGKTAGAARKTPARRS